MSAALKTTTEDERWERTYDGFSQLHLMACARLEIHPESRGAATKVAAMLGITPQAYHNIRGGHDTPTISLLDRWASAGGWVFTRFPDGRIEVFEPPE